MVIVQLLSTGIVLFIGFRKTKERFNDVFKFKKTPVSLWLIITVFMLGAIVVMSEIDNIFNYILPMPDFFKSIFDSMMINQAFVISIILIGIIPGITEEMFFRGLVLNGLGKNYSKAKAIVISALLFGLIHLNPWQFVTAFIIGLFSAWICLNTNSILLSIYIHLLNNCLYLFAARFTEAAPLNGFNANYAFPVEFQPLWVDILGVVIVVAGILLLKNIFGGNKRETERSPDVL
jgi:membrane protease YdiL (CAAX protease family)